MLSWKFFPKNFFYNLANFGKFLLFLGRYKLRVCLSTQIADMRYVNNFTRLDFQADKSSCITATFITIIQCKWKLDPLLSRHDNIFGRLVCRKWQVHCKGYIWWRFEQNSIPHLSPVHVLPRPDYQNHDSFTTRLTKKSQDDKRNIY